MMVNRDLDAIANCHDIVSIDYNISSPLIYMSIIVHYSQLQVVRF